MNATITNLLLWYFIFLFGTPLLLAKTFGVDILRYYLAVVDILANIFANSDKTQLGSLYSAFPNDILSYFSTNFISLVALAAVSWNAIHYAFKFKSIYSGVFISVIMYSVTYLIPVQTTSVFMKRYEDIASSFIRNRPTNVFLIGFLLLVTLMIIENFLIYVYFQFLKRL